MFRNKTSSILRSRVTRILLALGWALFPSLGWTVSPTDIHKQPLINEADLLVDIPLISSATRLSQKRSEAPASITVIDREMIEASGAQEIADLFRLVPGFQSYQVNAHKFGVIAHGIGNDHPGRMEVMVDGRSVYLSALSSVDWRSLGIGLSDIDSIEVVRGSNVPAYGSNAFLGAINIITRSTFKDRGSQLEVVGGSQDSGRMEFNHNTSLGSLGMRLSAGALTNKGFGVEDGGQGRYVNLRTTATPNLSDTFDLQLGYSEGKAGIGIIVLPILERSYQAHYQSLSWNRELNNTDNLQIQFYHNFFEAEVEHIPLSAVFPLPGSIPDEPFNINLEEGNTERFDLELQHRLRLLPGVRAVWGIGFRQDRGQSADLFNTQAAITEDQWRLFANLEWYANQRLVWNLGAMSEYQDPLGLKTSPRLGLNYQLKPGHGLRASYTLAYRLPSLLDSHIDAHWIHSNGTDLGLVINNEPDLQPGQNRTLELGYLGSLPRLKLDIDVKLFHEQVSRGIGRVMSPDPRRPETPATPQGITRTHSNNNQWRANGLEMQLKFRPSPLFWLALQYSYLDLEGQSRLGKTDPLNTPVDQDLSELTSRHSVGLLASQRLAKDWDLSLNYYHQSATGFFDGSAIDSYQRLDTRLAKSFRQGNTETKIALVVQNLLDEGYAEYQLRNQFDRRAYLSLTLHFL